MTVREYGSLAVETPGRVHMRKELFGVFGSPETFARYRSPDSFDEVVRGEAVTFGVRDDHLGRPGRTHVYDGESGCCVVWGEAFIDDPETDGDGTTDDGTETARRLFEAYRERGTKALSTLNGSYVAVVEHDGDPIVATDAIRTWECFYTDAPGVRAFGTDLATIAPLVDDPSVRRDAALEFLHLGTVLGTKTLFEPIDRVPFDGVLTPAGTDVLDRFVYDPAEFDHAGVLAERLGRALRRRRAYPGPKGLLLSAGQDSRSILAAVPDVRRCYTVGFPDSQEVSVARRIANQYGATHVALPPDRRYLAPGDRKILYSQGLRESLHVHHAGYDDELKASTVYHGLLYDTLFKGFFLERAGLDLLGTKVAFKSLDENVDPAGSLLDTLGYLPEGSACLAGHADGLFPGLDLDVYDPGSFLRGSIEAELAACHERADSVHNAMDLLVVRNQPTLAFRTHLADSYVEAFVAADRELLDWHCRTPPEQRTPETVHDAIAALDADVFRHRPPRRPRNSPLLNQAERFARRTLPLVEAVEPAWPDRRAIYEAYGLDDELFPDHRQVHVLPPRIKLRLNDLRWWLTAAGTRGLDRSSRR